MRKPIKGNIVVGVALTVLMSVPPAFSQETGGRPVVLPQGSVRTDSELEKNIEFCRGLIRDRNFEGASAFLEMLYEKHPDNPNIMSLLIQCYDKLQYYPKAEAIIRRQLEQEPDNLHLNLLVAEVLAQQGLYDESEQAYHKAVSLVPKSNIVRLDAVVQSMVSHNLNDPALAVIDSLRIETGRPELFAVHRGTILERKKEYALATLEFYPSLRDSTALGLNAERRVVALLDFVESAPAAESTLIAQNDLFSNVRALKILSAHFLKSGKYDQAFDFAVQQDSLENKEGRTLLEYMRRCSELKLYTQTVRMGEYLLNRSETLYRVPGAYFAYADALTELGRYPQAFAAYDTIYATFTDDRDRALALYETGDIYLNRLNDGDRALVYFDSVKVHFTHNPVYEEALLGTALSYLAQGDLSRANKEFESASKRQLDEDQAEEVDYYLALIFFFEREIDSAKAGLNRLLVDYPRGFYVNDAVRLLFAIDRAQNDPEILADYSQALCFEQRRLPDSSAVRLELIAAREDGVLADIALLKLAEIELSKGDSAAAIERLDSLVARFSDSYYLPLALKRKADIMVVDSAKVGEARDIYRRLLEQYSDYPFAAEVRQKLRELESATGSA